MTIDPVVDTAVCDEVAKLRGECPVDGTSFELVRHQFKRWHMVSRHDYMLGATCGHASFDELTAPIMLLIETLRREPELSVSDTVKVSHTTFSLIFIPRVNLRPKRRSYEVYVRV